MHYGLTKHGDYQGRIETIEDFSKNCPKQHKTPSSTGNYLLKFVNTVFSNTLICKIFVYLYSSGF